MADTIRVASFNTELSRKGPGLLLRDITRGDAQADAVASVIADVAPDVLVLQGLDYDYEGRALSALAALVARKGHEMPFAFTARPNSGWMTALDLDGDGKRGGPGDAQGWGRFAGAGGMAILSRFPLGEVHDLSGLLWAAQDWALLPRAEDGKLFPSDAAYEVQRLSSVAHWVVPVMIDGRRLDVLAFHATPPVFDGPEDRNGRRNHDEIMLWRHVLDEAGDAPFVIAGDANLDPVDGQGIKSAITGLLGDRRVQDPRPRSAGARDAADAGQAGDPALDTVDWPGGAGQSGPGNLRVDYVLPSAGLELRGAGVFWPAQGQSGHDIVVRASRHRLVWADIGW